MGGHTECVYTAEQQRRLHVDELGRPQAPQKKAEDDLAKKTAEDEAAARRSRPASPRLFSNSLVAQRMTPNRSGSSGANTRAAYGGAVTTKAAQDSAILTAVRRQMEALEDKLSGQIQRVQQQSDRLRDAALSRVDSKMGTMEAIQPKLDRRLAELSGNYKGLSDEMQAQIRRLDQMDSRLWEWRHQMEEEVRTKFTEIEQAYQKIQSSLRVSSATNDDLHKRHNQRVLRLEGLWEDRQAQHEEATQGLLSLHSRLSELEEMRNQDVALYNEEAPVTREIKPEVADMPDRASLMHVETRLQDAGNKIDHLIQESHEMATRIEAQEQRLKSLQTRHETKEDQYRELKDRVERTDMDNRLKEMQNGLQEMQQSKIEHGEKLELLERKMDSSEQGFQQAHDEACDHIRQLHRHMTAGLQASQVDCDGNGGLGASEAFAMDVKDCMSRLESSEAKLDQLSASVEQSIMIGPRVEQLMDVMKDVAPKMREQESSLREVHEKVGRLGVDSQMDPGRRDGLSTRMDHIEVEIKRLSTKIDSTG